jgi:crotonobetainyl-CoA:carnitine CoA-transferase CaiB-like acyl-CoA transferase
MGEAEPRVSVPNLPLAGFRILSAEQYGAGPYATMFLAQLGAEVIKIEPPGKIGPDGKRQGGGDTAREVGPHYLRPGESVYFQSFNLNKKSLTLDLTTDEGQVVLRKLAGGAHAIVNNLRGDLPEKLGLTYAALAGINPAIVCGHLSAYGRDNERARWPGYDYLMQAEGGWMALTGDPEGDPQRAGLSLVDFMTGTIMAVGLLASLTDAQRSGQGRDVDVDLLSAAVHQLSYPALWYLNAGDVTQRTPRSAHPSVTPSQLVKTADGSLFVMAQLPKFWTVLVTEIGHPELAHDARFATPAARLANRDVLTAELDRIFAARTTAQWFDLLKGKMPVSAVNGLDAALDNPFLAETGMLDVVEHPDRADFRVLANPIRLDGQRLPNRAAPLLGADTDSVLAEAGLTVDEINALRAAGTI